MRLGGPPELPPAFDGSAGLFMVTLAAQMAIALLVLKWGWRTCWAMYERPHALKSPVTVSRLIVLMLLVAIIFRGGGDLVYNMRYADMTPAGRDMTLRIDAAMDALAFIPFGLAWMLDRMGGTMVVYQLERHPFPLHLWPSWGQMVRPLQMAVGVTVLAFILTYLR